MDAPIVFISRFRIADGRAGDFAKMMSGAFGMIGEAKPRTALFAAYVDDQRAEARIVHVFPDADAMTVHFAGSEERSQSLGDLAAYTGFEVYGAAPQAAVDQLRREAAAAGVAVTLLPEPIGGFLRAPA
jgi:hypothetical protein